MMLLVSLPHSRPQRLQYGQTSRDWILTATFFIVCQSEFDDRDVMRACPVGTDAQESTVRCLEVLPRQSLGEQGSQ